jgi:hypothetical protein
VPRAFEESLAHERDHLNAYRIPCSAVAAPAHWRNGRRSLSPVEVVGHAASEPDEKNEKRKRDPGCAR